MRLVDLEVLSDTEEGSCSLSFRIDDNLAGRDEETKPEKGGKASEGIS